MFLELIVSGCSEDAVDTARYIKLKACLRCGLHSNKPHKHMDEIYLASQAGQASQKLLMFSEGRKCFDNCRLGEVSSCRKGQDSHSSNPYKCPCHVLVMPQLCGGPTSV